MKKCTIGQHAKIAAGIALFGTAMALLSILLNKTDGIHWTFWVAVSIVVIGIVYRCIFIKCPHCGDSLFGCRILPNHCPNCGKNLEENPLEEST